jgi:Tol biopolymer transport system component
LRQIKWFDRSGKELGLVGDPIALGGSQPDISADGRTLVVDLASNGNTDLWLIDIDTGKLTQFTNPPGIHVYPVFSPDARTIYFASNQAGGASEMYEKAAAGDAPEKFVMAKRATRLPRDVSKDGRFLLYRGGARDIWAVQLDGNPRAEFSVVETSGLDDWPKFSPDGRWIVYQTDESGRNEVYIQPFPSGPRTRVSADGGVFPFWSGNGKEIVYLDRDNKFIAVPMEITESSETVNVGMPSVLFAPPIHNTVDNGLSGPPFIVLPDGQRFLIETISYVSTPIKVIKNWQGRP